MGIPRSLTSLLALSVVAAVPATAGGAATGQLNVDASVVPLNVDAAVVPIDVQDSVQPLAVQSDRGTVTTVTLSSDVLFAFNSSTLTATARQTIDRIAGGIQSRGVTRIALDGYTDGIGVARPQPWPLGSAGLLGAAGSTRHAERVGAPDRHARARRG